MRVAFGFKAHSGWAALVALAVSSDGLKLVERRRIDLVDEDDPLSASQPYHAAEELKAEAARRVAKGGIEAARRIALREMRAAVKRAREAKLSVSACAVLVGDPMPDWSVDEILAVHFRMHKAEGVLFRDALILAAKACDLRVIEVPEKRLSECAEIAFAAPISSHLGRIARLGKSAGPPWGKDQKEAAIAAMIALEGSTK